MRNSSDRRSRGTRRVLAGTTVVVALLAAAGAAAGTLDVRSLDDVRELAARAGGGEREPASTPGRSAQPAGAAGPTVAGTSEAAPTPSPAPSTAPAATLTAAPEPEPVLEPGDEGVAVRELQGRLSQLAWYVPPMSGRFDAATGQGVRGFQDKRGFARDRVTGVVDERTWRRLVAMTRTPTPDEMFNRAGPAIYERGDRGPEVRRVQARLRQLAWFAGDVTDVYGDQTVTAVRGFQAKRHVPVTGTVDRRTLDLLVGMSHEPTADELANRRPDPADGAALDPRCRTGRVLCIDKTSRSLRWVVDGHVERSLDVRFGAEYTPTREGVFSVYRKSRDHVSTIYHTPMPYAMFFSGGQAVHYSSDFAARGYAGASHGCVNVRDQAGVAALFDQVGIGDKVVVYWS